MKNKLKELLHVYAISNYTDIYINKDINTINIIRSLDRFLNHRQIAFRIYDLNVKPFKSDFVHTYNYGNLDISVEYDNEVTIIKCPFQILEYGLDFLSEVDIENIIIKLEKELILHEK